MHLYACAFWRMKVAPLSTPGLLHGIDDFNKAIVLLHGIKLGGGHAFWPVSQLQR
jgi:hypothetical protein